MTSSEHIDCRRVLFLYSLHFGESLTVDTFQSKEYPEDIFKFNLHLQNIQTS